MRLALAALVLLASLARAEVQTDPASGLQYEVVQPTGLDATAPAPLLVCLHGAGDGLVDFRRGLRVIAPAVRRFRCLFVQSPDKAGWPRGAQTGVAAIASAVAAAQPTRGTILMGYSAGGWVGAVAVWRSPEVFEGALLVGSIGLEPPPRELGPGRQTPSVFWSLGTEDNAVKRNGGFDLAALEKHLADAGWAPERWRIDALEGKGHAMDGPSVERGLAFLAARLEATTPATDEDRAAAARVPGLIEAKDWDGLRQLVLPIADSRRGEAKGLLAAALLDLPKARDPATSRAGIDLLGALGDARAVPVLAGLADKLARDPARHHAAIAALGRLGGPAACAALVKVARKADPPEAQLAAVAALARCGGRDEVAPLLQELDEAEDQRKEQLSRDLNGALRELTGQEITGARMWRAWRDAVKKAEKAAAARGPDPGHKD